MGKIQPNKSNIRKVNRVWNIRFSSIKSFYMFLLCLVCILLSISVNERWLFGLLGQMNELAISVLYPKLQVNMESPINNWGFHYLCFWKFPVGSTDWYNWLNCSILFNFFILPVLFFQSFTKCIYGKFVILIKEMITSRPGSVNQSQLSRGFSKSATA